MDYATTQRLSHITRVTKYQNNFRSSEQDTQMTELWPHTDWFNYDLFNLRQHKYLMQTVQ